MSWTSAALAAARTVGGIRVHLEARDVLRHGAGEQLHVLRQVTHMSAEILRQPLLDRCAVEADLAAPGGPDADQHAGKRRLA